MPRLCFINPFGTNAYDELIMSTVTPSLAQGTDVEIRHLDAGAPTFIDYYVPKHIAELAVLRAVLAAERDGFDAAIIGCCYDPGLTQARELVNIPVVGALESSVSMARMFGHRFAVITDHRKAVPMLEDIVRVYGLESECRVVEAIDWFMEDMLGDPDAVAADAHDRCRQVLQDHRAEVAVLGCTIVAACYERAVLNGNTALTDVTIVNPNTIAVKMAQMLAELHRAGQYRMSRSGYYQQHATHSADEAREALELLEASARAALAE